LICLNFRIAGVVQFSRQHFLFLCAHAIGISLCVRLALSVRAIGFGLLRITTSRRSRSTSRITI
jgi:hypothetical protein